MLYMKAESKPSDGTDVQIQKSKCSGTCMCKTKQRKIMCVRVQEVGVNMEQ